MFNQNSGFGLSDIAAVVGNRNGNGGFGDGEGWWIILFLMMFGWGNNGNGWGNGGGGEATRAEVSYGFDMNGLDNGIRGIQTGLCDGFYAINTGLLNSTAQIQNSLCQGFNGVTNSVTTTGYNLQQAITNGTIDNMQNTNAITTQLNSMAAANAACCCETQRQIERGFGDLNYNLATQACDTRRAISDSTRDIIDSNNAGVRSILDFLTQDKLATLTAENQGLRLAASQAAQNNYLISQLLPTPRPAYLAPNPYANYNYGYANCGAMQVCGC